MSISYSKFSLKILNDSDAVAVSELRAKAYRARYGPAVDVGALRWNSALTHVLNLGIYANGDSASKLVSSYRLDVIADRSTLQEMLQTKRSEENSPELFKFLSSIELPVVVSCRAATDPDLHENDLHLALRYWSLKILQRAPVQFVLSTFEGTNRWSSLLKAMGYEIRTNSSPWTEFLKNQSPPVVASLNLTENAEAAAVVLMERLVKSLDPSLLKELVRADETWSLDPTLNRWMNGLNQ